MKEEKEKRKKARISVFPAVVRYCEFCSSPMVPAPRGSTTLACIGCGRVCYPNLYDLMEAYQ